jgi:hypothetical protein
VAGAAVELELARSEVERLRRAVRVAGVPLAPEVLEFYRACYVAFQLGSYRMAADAARARNDDGAETERLEAATARYRGHLAALLSARA